MAEGMEGLVRSKSQKEIIENLLNKDQRMDGRSFLEYRGIEIQQGALDNAEGSALAKVGDTQILSAIKFDVSTPYSDRPREGNMITSAEFSQIAHPHFESGPPGEDAIELARVIDRGIRSAEIIDFKSFFIEEGKVMTMFIDLWILNNSGNMMDAAGFAAAAALANTKIPKVEDGKIIRDEFVGDLSPKTLPVPTTFVKVGSHWLLDPILDERKSADTVITITTTDTHLCSIQKGLGKLSREELLNNINISFDIGKDIRKTLA